MGTPWVRTGHIGNTYTTHMGNIIQPHRLHSLVPKFKEGEVTWRIMSLQEERLEFVKKAFNQAGSQTFQEICEEFNISCKTGYKWYNRFLKEGEAGLKNQSKARLTQQYIAKDLEKTIIDMRKAHNDWGPKKIKGELKQCGIESPSASSIGNILKKHQLSKPRLYRRHVARTAPLGYCENPNDVWMYDFKGYFATGNGQICEPLTITDGHSRFLIRCVHMNRKRTVDVWEVLEGAFSEYGLPLRMRSDNGPPFASIGVGRLSPLAIKLIKVGVTPEWIKPGCPQENGRHERFHLTLKNEAASPPALNLKMQILKMDQFGNYYNFSRPHEALDFLYPGQVFKSSTRKWDGKFRSPEYSNDYETRKVGKCGNIGWKGMTYFLSESLGGEYVGIKEIELGIMGIFYGPILLGKINLSKGFKRE